jgi:hypothetical protein
MGWMAMIAMAAAALLTEENNRRTANKADAVTSAGIRKQAKNQEEVNKRLNKTVQDVKDSTAEPARAKAAKSYLDQVQNSMATANAGLAQRGISQQFDEMAGGAANDATAYGQDTANLLARMDAGGLQRQGEANMFGKLGQDLSIMGGNIKGDDFINQMQLRGVRRNPYMDIAASLLGAYGSGGKSASSGNINAGASYGSPNSGGMLSQNYGSSLGGTFGAGW